MRHQNAPGTTFKRHMAIARGLMSEDDYLLSEILFNPNTPEQLERIREKLTELRDIVVSHDYAAMKRYLDTVRKNLS
jgi:prephenate dehydrogenase